MDETKAVIQETEPAQKEETKVDTDALQAELAQARKDLEQWKTEAKAHQSTASKKAEEARRLQDKLFGIDARLDVFAEVLEESLKKPEVEEMEEKPQKQISLKERLQEKLKAVPVPPDTEKLAHMKEVANEIASIEKESNIDFQKIDDDRVVTYWQAGKFEKARDIAKEIVKKMVDEKKEVSPADKENAELKAEIERLKKVASGSLNSEKGLPVGGSKSFQEIEKAYIEGNIPKSEYIEARKKQRL